MAFPQYKKLEESRPLNVKFSLLAVYAAKTFTSPLKPIVNGNRTSPFFNSFI